MADGRVGTALVKIGKDAAPHLIQMLSVAGCISARAVSDLAGIGEPALPDLRAALKDPNPDVRKAATEALERIAQARKKR